MDTAALLSPNTLENNYSEPRLHLPKALGLTSNYDSHKLISSQPFKDGDYQKALRETYMAIDVDMRNGALLYTLKKTVKTGTKDLVCH